jgi:hypothetical protein
MIKFDIMEKPGVLYFQTERSVFTVTQNLYIKASVVYLTSWTYTHVLHGMHMFPRRF